MVSVVRTVLVFGIATLAAFLIETSLDGVPLWVPMTAGIGLTLIWAGTEILIRMASGVAMTEEVHRFIDAADGAEVSGDEWKISGTGASKLRLAKLGENSRLHIGKLEISDVATTPDAAMRLPQEADLESPVLRDPKYPDYDVDS